jgi:penicillin-binding protein 2
MDSRVRSIDKTDKFDERLDDLQGIIEKCTRFGVDRRIIESRIKQINDRIWNLRTFLAWRRSSRNSHIIEKYNGNINSVPLSEALADFQEKFPRRRYRLELIKRVIDIADMQKDYPLLTLKTDDDVFTAQIEFLDVQGIKIHPQVHRFYPYGPVAAHSIGWVGSHQQSDKQLFEDDKFASYLPGDVSGREDGAEYVCERILRGRRGEVVYDLDEKMINRAETTFGKDVLLTIDLELQKRIENHLTNSRYNRNYKNPTAAVVLEVQTGEILALVSMPSFDLNRIKYDYQKIASDPNRPLLNRAINKQYPPGSVVKPLILIAAMEEGQISPDGIISCPAEAAARGWPNCMQFRRFNSCHDWKWESDGGNKARNAIKGSCNVYFSRLADRIPPASLQKWLFHFGYGHRILPSPLDDTTSKQTRNLRQQQGQISQTVPKNQISKLEQLPPLGTAERRWFGMGQGNLRATILQVANSMAAIARGGVYKPPKLFITDPNNNQNDLIDPNLSPLTLQTVYDGMAAVVNEPGGSAYSAFAYSDFAGYGVRVYGKTGSTERPYHALFAGFAKDRQDRALAIAVVVEAGQSGSRDAAPLAREIIQFCIEAGYIGPQQD